jgi:SAM-dependent methyltransferase
LTRWEKAPASVFDALADLYATARPGYPERVVDDLLDLSETPAAGRVLEVGAGTGQATEALARRGLSVVLAAVKVLIDQSFGGRILIDRVTVLYVARRLVSTDEARRPISRA